MTLCKADCSLILCSVLVDLAVSLIYIQNFQRTIYYTLNLYNSYSQFIHTQRQMSYGCSFNHKTSLFIEIKANVDNTIFRFKRGKLI